MAIERLDVDCASYLLVPPSPRDKMSAKPISTHVVAVLAQMEKVEALTRDQQAQIINELYTIMEAKQRGAIIIRENARKPRKAIS